jgi:hypothetical protein
MLGYLAAAKPRASIGATQPEGSAHSRSVRIAGDRLLRADAL